MLLLQVRPERMRFVSVHIYFLKQVELYLRKTPILCIVLYVGERNDNSLRKFVAYEAYYYMFPRQFSLVCCFIGLVARISRYGSPRYRLERNRIFDKRSRRESNLSLYNPFSETTRKRNTATKQTFRPPLANTRAIRHIPQ